MNPIEEQLPIVDLISEAETALEEIEANEKEVENLTTVKVQLFGKSGYYTKTKTFGFKNPKVQKLVLEAIKTHLRDTIESHKKQLEKI